MRLDSHGGALSRVPPLLLQVATIKLLAPSETHLLNKAVSSLPALRGHATWLCLGPPQCVAVAR